MLPQCFHQLIVTSPFVSSISLRIKNVFLQIFLSATLYLLIREWLEAEKRADGARWSKRAGQSSLCLHGYW